MVVPAFGFSVGDFIAAIKLIKQASVALKDTGGAADEFQSLYRELQQLQTILEQLRHLPTASTSSQNHYNAVRGLACDIQAPLQAFVEKMEAYLCRLGPRADTSGWRSAKRKVQWATSMREDVGELRIVLTMKMATVFLLLALPMGDTLGHIEKTVDETKSHSFTVADQARLATASLLKMGTSTASGVRRLNQRQAHQRRQTIRRDRDMVIQHRRAATAIGQVTNSLKLYACKTHSLLNQVVRIFSDPSKEVLGYLQQLNVSSVEMHTLLIRLQNNIVRGPTGLLEDNIIFVDVLNRQHSLPYAFFQHWEVFTSMLICEFKNKPGEAKVQNGEYLIIDAKSSGSVIRRER